MSDGEIMLIPTCAQRGSTYTRQPTSSAAYDDGFIFTSCAASHLPARSPTVTRAMIGSMYSPVAFRTVTAERNSSASRFVVKPRLKRPRFDAASF